MPATATLPHGLFLTLTLLDLFANRDPCYYVGQDYLLVASWSAAPLALIHSSDCDRSFQLHDVSELKIGVDVYIGRAEEHCPSLRWHPQSTLEAQMPDGKYFIVHRGQNAYDLYATAEERDKALMTEYCLPRSELWDMPWYAGLQGNPFFPYDLIYYGALLLVIAACYRAERRNAVGSQRMCQSPDGAGVP